jgi:hypothetical protein
MAIDNNGSDRTNGYGFGNKWLSVMFERAEKAASGKAQ